MVSLGGGGAGVSGAVTSIPSLLQQMAPTVFTMNPNDATKILFPPTVEHIIIDVGAADSVIWQPSNSVTILPWP